MINEEVSLQEFNINEKTILYINNQFKKFIDEVAEWELKAKTIKVTDISQVKEMKEAREARLALKKTRVNAEKIKNQLKRDALNYSNAVQKVFNVIKDSIKPIEEYLQEQENFKIKYEAELKEKLTEERIKDLGELNNLLLSDVELGELSELEYTKLKQGLQKELDFMKEKEAQEKKQKELEEQNKHLLERLEKLEKLEKEIKKQTEQSVKSEVKEKEKIIQKQEQKNEIKKPEDKEYKPKDIPIVKLNINLPYVTYRHYLELANNENKSVENFIADVLDTYISRMEGL